MVIRALDQADLSAAVRGEGLVPSSHLVQWSQGKGLIQLDLGNLQVHLRLFPYLMAELLFSHCNNLH